MKVKSDDKPGVAKTLGIGVPKPGQALKRWAIPVLLVIGAVVAFAAIGTGSKSTVMQYKTEQVRRGDLTVVVTATGTLQPTNKVEVGSEISGSVKSVEADYNGRVKVGQVLAVLDTSKLEAQLTQSKAALESNRAKVLQTRATVAETKAKLAQLQKVRELSNGKVPSRAEMDAAEAAFERAKADAASAAAAVTQAEASLQVVQTDLSKSVIRSPVEGIVLTRSVEPGQTVAASFTTPVLFTLAEDLTRMDLHVNVDEADIGHIKEGQRATFTVAAYPNRTFDAKITQARFGSSTTSGVVTYETVLKVSNADLSLRPGMTATADITTKKLEKAILIPSAALRFTPPADPGKETKPSVGLVGSLLPRPPTRPDKQDSGNDVKKREQKIWTLEKDRLVPVTVTIGASNGSVTEVVAGNLQPGTQVVVDVAAESK